MTGMLASITNLQEALQVLKYDVDIIDLKDPAQGALGDLEIESIKTIVQAIKGQRRISATIGDLPMHPQTILSAVLAKAETDVDFIKIGFFPGGDWHGTLDALADLGDSGTRMIAVLFADTQPELGLLNKIKSAQFRGVMLDTMDKQKGSLTDLMPQKALQNFVEQASANHLICGLAGSLRLADIPALKSLKPDYLGFRGALCSQQKRTAELDEPAIKAICSLIKKV
ncbi:MAG: (5-formylfuran-3-yl)methyl phosphate synthase [Methylicorpusculum sp.]|nr:(5-formylfuran-3-yl)methyl phosphate synthase [Methylicorpusculum sp.]